MKLKTKRKAAASSQKYRGKQSYGIGGAVMTLGKNLLQGKKLGSGAFKGVLRAGITPGSGIGAGIGLAGALAGRSKNPNIQKLGQGLGMAGNLAGLFTGGQGGGMSALMDRFKAEEGMKMPYSYGGKMKVMKEGGLVGGLFALILISGILASTSIAIGSLIYAYRVKSKTVENNTVQDLETVNI